MSACFNKRTAVFCSIMLVIGLVLILCLSAFGARNSPANSRLRVQSPEDPTKTLRLVHTVRKPQIKLPNSLNQLI